MPFTVIVADNFHYMDKSENYVLGTFDTLESAIDASQRIVDDYPRSALRPGMSAQDLFSSYVTFGEDPYIVSSEVKGVAFSAWDYAKERCEALCVPDLKHDSER